MIGSGRTWPLVLVCVTVVSGCARAESADPAGDAGRPLVDLTDAELGRFLLGKAVFERLIVPDEGLGPLFNADRCSACHDLPVTGGAGLQQVTKATRFEGGACDLLESYGGDNIQQRATPQLAAHGITGEAVPAAATAVVRVTSPPLYGLGLIEAIADADIIAREDPEDANGDGVRGRAAREADGRVGRFGRKSEFATLAGFIDTALRFEVGLTTPRNPREELPNGQPLPAGVDPMPEPEIDENGVALLTEFIRYLAPPARDNRTGAAADTVARGERLFSSIGCSRCHTPELRTARNAAAALDRRTVRLYSDLLLHDLGPDLASVCGPQATPSEWRTAPLWGVRYRTALLHDGRAATPRDAIRFHGGEAAAVRASFEALSPGEQEALLRFLSVL